MGFFACCRKYIIFYGWVSNESIKSFGRKLGEVYHEKAYARVLYSIGGSISDVIFAIDEALESDGSCFGMAAVACLIEAGELSLDFFGGEDATCTYKLNTPYRGASVTDRTIFNLINFYQIIQGKLDFFFANELLRYDLVMESTNNKALIDALAKSNYPVVLLFEANAKHSGVEDFDHAVVAYSYCYRNGEYVVEIYNPNKPDNPIYLYISEDFQVSEFANTRYDSENFTSYLEYTLTVEDHLSALPNIQECLISKGYTCGADANSTEGNTIWMVLPSA